MTDAQGLWPMLRRYAQERIDDHSASVMAGALSWEKVQQRIGMAHALRDLLKHAEDLIHPPQSEDDNA